MQSLVSSLSAGDCLVHRLSLFFTGAQDSHLQRVTMPEASYIQLRRRPPEDEQGNARKMYRILINVLYINKQVFCASSWRSKRLWYDARSTNHQDQNYYSNFFHVSQEYCCMLHSCMTILSVILVHFTIYYMNTEILEILWCEKLLEVYYYFFQKWKYKPKNMLVILYHAGYTYSEQVYTSGNSLLYIFDLQILYILPSRLKCTRCNDIFDYGMFHYTYQY
jgi:hypothetical protein